MSWDYVVDEKGNLEIIVSRWYNESRKREVRLLATGFEPYEPVQVEVCGEDEHTRGKDGRYERKRETA
jgi:hypothetical protein